MREAIFAGNSTGGPDPTVKEPMLLVVDLSVESHVDNRYHELSIELYTSGTEVKPKGCQAVVFLRNIERYIVGKSKG
jgi:hypothetical protein